MSIKVKMTIKLPYILRLQEEKNYEFSFIFDDFEMFKLEMLFNDEDNYERYDKECPHNSCSYVYIEAIYKHCNHSVYNKRNTGCISHKQFIIELPYSQRDEIFKAVNSRLKHILYFLRDKTNMFWIEPIPIRPISHRFEDKVEYNFFSPDSKVSMDSGEIMQVTDYYMESSRVKNIKTIDDNIFNNFNNTENKFEKFKLYLYKAEKSLYEHEYEDFIIYSSISVESFIRKYISDSKPEENDIVFNRISNSSYEYLDQYYNVLLKYLKGKSLNELYDGAFVYFQRMYKLRNAIMHRGHISKEVLKKVGLNHLEYINFNECKKILECIKKSFELIEEM